VRPFVSLYVPFFRRVDGELARPEAFARCRDSIYAQWLPRDNFVQPLFVEDATPGGSGVGGMFAQVPANADRVEGDYVMILGDDDVLADETVVGQLYAIAEAASFPDVIIVSTEKGAHGRLPYDQQGPPICGRIDLGCVVTRRDVWLAHVHDYGDIYEGDFRHLDAMWRAGRHFHYATGLLFSRGAVSRGGVE
jgi:hypothetical protein